jgi:hypothetical protein
MATADGHRRSAQGQVTCEHVLQVTAMPPGVDPLTVQVPAQDCRQSQEMGAAPQVLATHSTMNAPPTRARQIWPAGQVRDWLGQSTVVQGPVVTDHLGSTVLPATQEATVRPAPAQSS